MSREHGALYRQIIIRAIEILGFNGKNNARNRILMPNRALSRVEGGFDV